MKNPLISICIPTYNGETYIRPCIESVLNQTFKNFEYIIVDDGSTEDIKSVVEGFKDERMKCIRHPKNKMIAAAYNSGLKAAKGKFAAFLESDDKWLPEKLERQLEIFEKNKEVGVVYCGLSVRTVDGTILRERHPRYSGDVFENCLERNVVYVPSVLMVRKSLLDKEGFFDSSFDPISTYELIIRLAKVTKFDFVDQILVHYLQHEKNFSNQLDDDLSLQIKIHEAIYKKHQSDFKRYPGKCSERLRNLGIHYCQYKNPKKGRYYFLEAIKVNSANLKSFRDYLLSFLPTVFFDFLYNLKEKIK